MRFSVRLLANRPTGLKAERVNSATWMQPSEKFQEKKDEAQQR